MQHYGSQYLDLRSLRNIVPLVVRRSIIAVYEGKRKGVSL